MYLSFAIVEITHGVTAIPRLIPISTMQSLNILYLLILIKYGCIYRHWLVSIHISWFLESMDAFRDILPLVYTGFKTLMSLCFWCPKLPWNCDKTMLYFNYPRLKLISHIFIKGCKMCNYEIMKMKHFHANFQVTILTEYFPYVITRSIYTCNIF